MCASARFIYILVMLTVLVGWPLAAHAQRDTPPLSEITRGSAGATETNTRPAPETSPAPTGTVVLAAQAGSSIREGLPATGSAAPATETSITVMNPGTGFPIRRAVWLLALPVAILFFAYFFSRNKPGHRGKRAWANRLTRSMDAKDRQLFAFLDPDEPMGSPPNYKIRSGAYERYVDEDLHVHAAERWQPPLSIGGRDAAHGHRRNGQNDTDNRGRGAPGAHPIGQSPSGHGLSHTGTMRSASKRGLDEDEATYQLPEATGQALIGSLVRLTDDPNLPQELYVYGRSTARGDSHRIHIGRHSKSNTIVISHKYISREHAVIVQKETGLYLRDKASTAGTYLNWRRLKPGTELPLNHNDIVSFGEITYEFLVPGKDAGEDGTMRG